ncbi:ComEA family DNA-binding protein [Planosporangium thailandense]|uniref:ComEA family DNA-binding protein n=1 Tax=Planosporangium thailandense TaxID=765197 RepID=A0ABX0Y0S1_9ACTN|nr:ComEA family DNA-binding protein [Planosporangium thailandense]NJC71681.1 ComEA family DNA-binding protein [Planosporangium thailandense]
MFASRRDAADDAVRERFIRVVGLPEVEDIGAGPTRAATDPPTDPSSDPPTRLPPALDPSAVPPPALHPSADEGVVIDPQAGSGFADAGGLRGVVSALDPGRRGLRALAAVAAIGIAIAAFLAWRARPQVEQVAAHTEPAVAPSASSGPSGAVVVAVTGRVHHPGLIRLPSGARVADAVDAAGGALPDTDLSFVNLARKLTDGELVTIGVTPPPGVAAPAGGGAPGGGPAAGPLNLNTATAAQLEALPGIGPVLAQHIVDYRTRHGQFRSVDELRQVEGLGTARFNQLKPLVTV